MTTGSPAAGPVPSAPLDDEVAATRAERLADLQRSERIMTRIRYAAAAFALLQILVYQPPEGISVPSGVIPYGIGIIVVLVVGATAAWVISQRLASLDSARLLAVVSLSMDVLVASGFVWLYSFDPESAQWAILFILPLEGAVRFQLRGALLSWAAVTALYIGRELFAAERYGFEVAPESISFRMGLNLLIALVAGFMAQDLVGQRAKVASSLHQLARTDVLRRHLVSTLAHDVRGPLTTIRGGVRTVLDRTDIDVEQQQRLLQAVDRQAGRLQYLAADLLDLARLEQGRLELDLQPVRLLDVVHEASGYVDHEREFVLDIRPELTVQADPHRLEQVVVNLTANALRYGSPPYRIVACRDGDVVTVSFRDQGPGVPESKRDRLFEAFSNTDDAPGSVGLGLWVCQMLLEAQAGRLTYRYEPGAGSVFEVVLLAADEHAAPDVAAADRGSHAP